MESKELSRVLEICDLAEWSTIDSILVAKGASREQIEEAKLTYKKRQGLHDSSFVFPPTKNSPGRYPIDTINRARNALARVAQNGTPDEIAKVKAAVKKKYPSINVDGES